MANHTAASGVVNVTPSGGSANAVAEVRSMSFEGSAETIDATLLTSSSKVTKAGTKSYSGTVECFWDETDTTGQIALTEGAEATVDWLFEGATSGDYKYSLSMIVNSMSVSAAVDGMVEASFSFVSNGDLTRTTV